MADLNPSKTLRGAAVTSATRVTLTASDTFAFVPNMNQVLELHNTTAGALTAIIKGSAPSAAFPVPGATTVDLTAGLSVAIPANSVRIVQLDAIAAYLTGTGTVTVTGAAGAFAVLLTN